MTSDCPECKRNSSEFKEQWIGCTLCTTAWVCFQCAYKCLPCFTENDRDNDKSQQFYDDIVVKQSNGRMYWHYICFECEDKLHSLSPNQINAEDVSDLNQLATTSYSTASSFLSTSPENNEAKKNKELKNLQQLQPITCKYLHWYPTITKLLISQS